MSECDALFLGAHPDDVEIACAGTILGLVAAGRKVAVADMTAGEAASRGSAATRREECQRATALLGLRERVGLGLPDTGVTAGDAEVRALVAVVRRLRPELLFAPCARDIHPDHVATAELAGRAWYLSGLARFAPDAGPPHRPRLLVRYPGNDLPEPTFCVDITGRRERKEEVLRCYASQVDLDDTGHLPRGRDLLERSRVRDAWCGHLIGTAAAEAFLADGPLPVRDLVSLMGP